MSNTAPESLAPEHPARKEDIALAPGLAARVPTLAAILLIAALWLVTRPYRGVRHDGILYLGQTLAHLMPDTIGRDMFLAFGSQDRYSLFSVLMAPLVQWVGIAASQLWMLAACQVVFVFGCWNLTAELPTRFLRWCALLSLVSLAHTYTGGGGSFAFAEPFFTARSAAEALSVLALGFFLRGRNLATLLALMGAVALHALISLPVLVVIWVALCLRHPRWWFALAVPVVAAAAGALGVKPFDGLWQRFEPMWWENVHVANRNVFFLATRAQDWGTAAYDLLVVYLAGRLLRGTELFTLLKALAISAVALTVLWALGADLLHDVLLTQLQLWRIYWLMHLFALVLLPMPLANLWQRGPLGQWAAAALVLLALAVSANLSTELLCLSWVLLPLYLLHHGTPISPALARAAFAVSVLAIAIVTGIVGVHTRGAVSTFIERFNGTTDVQVILGLSAVSGLVGFCLLRGLAASGLRRGAALAATLVLAICATSWWDQRSDWQRFVEDGLHAPVRPFEGAIPASASLYWDASLLEPWLLMHHDQFFALEQGAGLLFSRPTAMEFAARENAAQPLLIQHRVCLTVAALMGSDDQADCSPPVEIIRDVCAANPRHPDFLVFPEKLDRSAPEASATWTFRPGDPIHSRTFRLYDCARLLSSAVPR